MLYYEFKIKAKEKFPVPDLRTEEREWASQLNEATEDLNSKQAYNVHFFIVDVRKEYMNLCGIIGYKNKDNPFVLAVNFAKDLGFDVDEKTIDGKEISIHVLAQNAHKAERSGFIYDDDRMLINAAIGGYSLCSSNEFTELIADENYTNEQAKAAAEETFCGETLNEEIDRIYTQQTQKTFIGHPVHYIIYSDDWDVTGRIVKILTSSLFANGRLKSRRVALVKPQNSKNNQPMLSLFEDNGDIDMDMLENLFSRQQGCSLVIRPNRMASESFFAREDDCVVEDLAKLINENKMETLTIVVMSKTEKTFVNQLKLNTPEVRYVEISEKPFSTEKAKEILINKAKEDNINDTAHLLEKLPEDDRAFYISDINRIYSQWLNDRLPVEVYPQYSQIKKTDVSLLRTKGSAYEELQKLIGLKKAKEVVKQALDYNKAELYFKRAGLTDMRPARHMIFTGNPGTAKTTVARLFARIMKDNGVLDKGDLIEVGRKDLVGKYVGWTAKLVEEAFSRAKGSVLFIDEAYSLCDDKAGLYGDEAINTIVQMMENQRDNTVVIFAGYPEKMKDFLDRNPGLRSRIAFNVNFDDYSTEELVEIFEKFATESKLNLADGVKEKITCLFEKARKDTDFGNGRYARNIFEHARMKQASRLVEMNSDLITDDIIKTITAEDIAVEPVIETKQESHVLGFAC